MTDSRYHLAQMVSASSLLCAACAPTSGLPAPYTGGTPPTATYPFTEESLGSAQTVDSRGKWIASIGRSAGDYSSHAYPSTLILFPLDASWQGGNPNTAVTIDTSGSSSDAYQRGGDAYDNPAIYFSPDSSSLAVANPPAFVPMASQPTLVSLSGAADCFAVTMAFSIDGSKLAALCDTEKLRVWETAEPSAPPQDIALPMDSLAGRQFASASLVAAGDNAWNVVLGGSQEISTVPVVFAATSTGVSVHDGAGFGLTALDTQSVALNPQVPDQLLYMGSHAQSDFQGVLISHVTSTPAVETLQKPTYSYAAKAVKFSPDGAFVTAVVVFNDASTRSSWQQAIAWRVTDKTITLSTTADAFPFTGNAFAAPGQFFAFLITSGQSKENVASWTF